MITYLFKCQCGRERTTLMHMADIEKRRIITCDTCGLIMRQVITGGEKPFARSSFPKGWAEHIAPDPVYITEKQQAREVAAEHGMTSGLVENWDR